MSMTKVNRRSFNHRTGERLPVLNLWGARPEDWSAEQWRTQLILAAQRLRSVDAVIADELHRLADEAGGGC